VEVALVVSCEVTENWLIRTAVTIMALTTIPEIDTPIDANPNFLAPCVSLSAASLAITAHQYTNVTKLRQEV